MCHCDSHIAKNNILLKNSKRLTAFSLLVLTSLVCLKLLFQWSTSLQNLTTLIIFRAPEMSREIAESIIEALPNLERFGDFHSFDMKRPQDMKRIQVTSLNYIQWGSKCSGDLNPDHLNTGNIWTTNFLKFNLQMVCYSNGRSTGYVLCTRPPSSIPDQYIIPIADSLRDSHTEP